jgi:hypothetical protein
MFFGYCLHPADGSWTPPVTLQTAVACSQYCAAHHSSIKEIRITDAADFIVLQVLDHVLRIPQADGTFQELALSPELVAHIRAEGAS